MMIQPGSDTESKPVTSGSMRWLTRLWPIFTLSASLDLWISALPGVDYQHMTDLGLLSVTPVTLYAALALLTVSFGLALRNRATPTLILLLHVILFILIVHGTPAILYPGPRYAWTWKHVGIIDFIQRKHRVDPAIGVLAIYHYWPGFFALGAFLTEIAGYKSAIAFAGWAPVFFNLIDLLALQLIFWSATNDRRLVWQSIWFFYLTNWIGQDYFSPQALAYFMHLMLIGICFRWFSVQHALTLRAIQRWLWFGWLARLYYWLVARAVNTELAMHTGGDRATGGPKPYAQLAMYMSGDRGTGEFPVDRPAQPGQAVLVFVILLFCAAVIISSHQLTPFMTLLTLTGLVLLGRCRSYLLPVLFAMMTLAWLVYATPLFLGAEIPSILKTMGTVEGNIDGHLVDLTDVPLGQWLVSLAARGLTLGVWGLAGLGALRRLRHGYWDLAFVVLGGAPFMMLGGSNYGGEILFRVFLFALPGMAFLAASLIYPAHEWGRSRWTTVSSIGLSALLLVAFLFAYWGKEQNYYFTSEEVAASEFLATTAPPNSLLVDGTHSYPSQYLNYEHFFSVSINLEPASSKKEILKNPVGEMERWMSNRKFAAAYLIITRSMKVDVRIRPSYFPLDGLDMLEQKLSNSPKFTVIYSNKDVKIFALTERVAPDHMITQASLGQPTSNSTHQEKP